MHERLVGRSQAASFPTLDDRGGQKRWDQERPARPKHQPAEHTAACLDELPACYGLGTPIFGRELLSFNSYLQRPPLAEPAPTAAIQPLGFHSSVQSALLREHPQWGVWAVAVSLPVALTADKARD